MKSLLSLISTPFIIAILPFTVSAQDSMLIDDQLHEEVSIEQKPVMSGLDLPPSKNDSPPVVVDPVPVVEDKVDTVQEAELSPWSASAFYLYNATTNKMLLVPSPGYEMGGFKANAQSASFTPKKFYDFEAKASTNWTIGQDADKESKLLFMANASIKRRLVVAVPFLEVSKGLSFKSDYSQVSMGASSFIPTPWFFILPKYTATYSNSTMNEFAYGVDSSGWSSGWGVTLLKPINKNWTFLAIYSAKKLEESLRLEAGIEESNQSLMMILSYQFNKKEL